MSVTKEIDNTADFIIAGVQKSGTTNLATSLAQHDQVFIAPMNEIPYFVDAELYSRGESWLSSHFIEAKRGQIIGMKSAHVITYEVAIERLYSYNPDIKIIVVFREPVARAYSAYWYARRIGVEDAETFEDAIREEMEDLPRRSNVSDIIKNETMYLEHGKYHNQIEVLDKYFKKEQIKLLLFEDILDDFTRTVSEISTFLCIDDTSGRPYSEIQNSAGQARSLALAKIMHGDSKLRKRAASLCSVNTRARIRNIIEKYNKRPFQYSALSEYTKKELTMYFEDQVLKLGKRIDRDLSSWLS